MRVSADGVVIARCKNEYDLSDTQRTMCLRQPELIPVIEGAEEAARTACGQQFRNDRWNCSGFNFLKKEQFRRYGTLYRARRTRFSELHYVILSPTLPFISCVALYTGIVSTSMLVCPAHFRSNYT